MRERAHIQDRHLAIALAVAVAFWINSFLLRTLNFWLSMSLAAVTLTTLSVLWVGAPYKKSDLRLRSVVLGIGSAVVLYGIFWLGNLISKAILPFASTQVADIYTIRTQAQALIIALILFFITSPGEEIFWRGFVQRWTMQKFGPWAGWLLAAAIYGAVHIFSGNFMLIMAAFVAGLFWGFMYLKEKDLVAVTISHALWTVGIFVLFPILGH
ncbi:MAG: CPBP family intramembrane metalloprotease [Actinomycetia bacterium]|nr:CPBP family intramembrane metalloprotease [Actinomycetes bacterium]